MEEPAKASLRKQPGHPLPSLPYSANSEPGVGYDQCQGCVEDLLTRGQRQSQKREVFWVLGVSLLLSVAQAAEEGWPFLQMDKTIHEGTRNDSH